MKMITWFKIIWGKTSASHLFSVETLILQSLERVNKSEV